MKKITPPPITTVREEEEESGTDEEGAVTANAEAPRIFVTNDGDPICFLFHKSVRKHGRADYLEKKIEEHGGMVLETLEEVHTILVDPKDPTVDIERMQRQYGCSQDHAMRKIFVEPLSFVPRCIARKKYVHILPLKQGLGGAPPRRNRAFRVPFTAADDHNLCQYIASRRPDKESGGRFGKILYQNLVDMEPKLDTDLLEYAWVKRHTWQAWRERYKQNYARLDPIIDEYVMAYTPREIVIDHRDRRYGKDTLRQQSRIQRETEEDDEDESDENLDELEESVDEREPSRGMAPSGTQKRRGTIDLRTVHNAGRSDGWDVLDPNLPARQDGPVRNKGKGRAHAPTPTLPDEDLHSFNNEDFPYDGDPNMYLSNDPGPSGTQLTPPGPTQISQRTLVATSPHLPSAWTQQLTNRNDVSASDKRPFSEETPTENLVATADVSPVPSLPPRTQTQKHATSAPKVITKPPTRVAKKTAARKVPSQPNKVTADSAPYRNTRSRSRSVEPVPLATKAAKSRKKKVQPTLLPIVEDLPEEEEMEVENLPVGETMEERDVADQLIENDKSAITNEDLAIGHAMDEDKLDSDDQQTRDALRSTADLDDDDNVSESERIVMQMRKAQRSQRGSAIPPDDVFRLTGPLVPASVNVPKRTVKDSNRLKTKKPLATPLGPRPKGEPSESEESVSFPSPGTRAYKARNRLEVKERRTPYEPPRGTRAAALRK